jgi:hypothetical protein
VFGALNRAPDKITFVQALAQRGREGCDPCRSGSAGATDEAIAVAEKLGAGVAKALLGKAALPDDLPYVTGPIGLLGSKPSYALMTECDTLFMIGSGFPYAGFMPEEGRARGVQIDIEPDMLSLRYPVEVNLVGDAAETLRLLLPLLKRKQDRKWGGEIEKQVVAWWKLLEERAMQPAKPVNPQRVVWELSPRLPDNAIVTSESGSCANWYARDLKMRRGMMASFSGGLASMGAAVPYAIAAKFARERWWPARRANSSAPFCLTIRTSRPRNRASVRPKEGHAHQEKHPKVNAAGEITHVFGHRFVLKTVSKCRCPCRLFWWYRSFGINDEPGPRGAGL